MNEGNNNERRNLKSNLTGRLVLIRNDDHEYTQRMRMIEVEKSRDEDEDLSTKTEGRQAVRQARIK